MFSRLEEDTKKQIERSKNGTRFFADYYKDYIKEEYIDNKVNIRLNQFKEMYEKEIFLNVINSDLLICIYRM